VIRRFSRIERGERLLKLIVPPRESAPLSGVWPLISSTCSNIAPVMLLTKIERFMPPWPVISPPSIVTLLSPEAMPRTENPDRLPPASSSP
jgi:hypothetical protein